MMFEPTYALSLDLKEQNDFVSFYNRLPEKVSSTIRFFSYEDFYAVFCEDVELASTFNGNITKTIGGNTKLLYATLNKSQFESFLRELLLVKQYRVEVYTKLPTKNYNWKIAFKGSPGNFSQFEDILFDNILFLFSNIVISIKVLKDKVVAIGLVDTIESKFGAYEIQDNDCFTELESFIAQQSPKECIIPAGGSDELKSVKKLLERNGILIAEVKNTDFNTDDVIQDLNRLLYFQEAQNRNALIYPQTSLKDAMSCLAAANKFLNLSGDENSFNQFRFELCDMNKYVRLDNSGLYALNILPKTNTDFLDESQLGNALRWSSLISLLDRCVTTQGKRLLRQWIKQPLRDINLLSERLDVVECFVKDAEIRTLLSKDSLTRVQDILLLTKKLSSKNITLQDCYKIYQAIGNVPNLVNVISQINNATIKSTLVEPLKDILKDLERFQQMVEEVLDFELVERGEYFIKVEYDNDLRRLRDEKFEVEEKMQQLLEVIASDLDLEGKVKLECNEQYGHFFRVTLKEEPILRSNKRYRILGALKGGVRFTSTDMSRLNEHYANLNLQYEDQQKSVVSEMFSVAGEYVDSLYALNKYIATVDVLLSFSVASVEAKIPYTRPILHKEGGRILKLKGIRHPCLEQQDQVSFIPNDIEFDNKDKTLFVVTGPNMCGKSTFIRSVGLCAFMAHIGCFLPCQMAEISILDGILVRVGADDCQLKGLSTFMLEMLETASIAKTSTPNSLVIIDELGRGTSTYDGCGIASAITEYLANVSCFSLFATHFHELSHMEEKYSNINNLRVTADTSGEIIIPLYSVTSGCSKSSYGIQCARMVNFPDAVVQQAINYEKELDYLIEFKNSAVLQNHVKSKLIKEGEAIIENTLQKLKTQDVNDLPSENILQIISQIKSAIIQDNIYVTSLLKD